MQIYDDQKRRIGMLSGFRNRAITKTLDSGDKELQFEYPANGEMEGMLREEYYIRTKEDEFILKEVETEKQYNKYTAVLNVEELEGKAFPFGFASREQTIRACLEFAFEDTGWSVGICTVTKKRTINIEEPATAWKVLQSCLSTYRCECEIDTLQKRVNIYTQIGQDRGCYFMEGMNLRRLTAKSDTYEFYTRIIPIGKDGITIEALYGKAYLENYQYSTKGKTYIWKDERYTNTTSLLEDAEAKLEELSKPYKVYSADVVDLANANQEYKNILDYAIGDTVMMVSKGKRIREKQRIVKIVEYPETPERNKVELSNTTKTFAEVQKSETELAKTEAIAISNGRVKTELQDNYYNKEEVESHITAAEDKISLGVSKSYATKESVESAEAKIDLNAEKIEQKVSKGNVSAEITLEPGNVDIKGNRLTVESENFKLSGSGTAEIKGELNTVSSAGHYTKIKGAGAHMHTEADIEIGVVSGFTSSSSPEDYTKKGITIGTAAGAVTVGVQQNRKINHYYVMNNGINLDGHTERHIFRGAARFLGSTYIHSLIFDGSETQLYETKYGSGQAVISSGGFYANGDMGCSGTKYRVVDTQHYGKVGMNALETAGAYFADVGSGVITKDVCFVYFDEIFSETVDDKDMYHVMVTGTNEKKASWIQKEKSCFIVHGEEGAEFDWIVIAKQKGYQMDRMEKVNVGEDPDIPYDESVFYQDGIAAEVSMQEDEDRYDEYAERYLELYDRDDIAAEISMQDDEDLYDEHAERYLKNYWMEVEGV